MIITSDSSKPAFTRYEGGRNYHTNVIRLKRFHVQELHRYDVLATSLSKLLMNSPNQELPLSEIQKQVVRDAHNICIITENYFFKENPFSL